jgi:alkaline phosphatase D
MRLNRREFLVGSAVAGLVFPNRARAQAPSTTSDGGVFPYGVASGDPLTDRVMLWTCVAASASTADVEWRIASDQSLTRIVAQGSVRTGAERDFTVKVDAGGLEPGRTYYYAFNAGRHRSAVGRTRTAPQNGIERVRVAVVSCSNYPAGYFNVYGRIAARADLDAVVHLGDYIYEFENGRFGDGTALGRVPRPAGEASTLTDYRLRYATYRTDPDLLAAHQQHPFITVWDDHELTNNAWRDGAQNHQPETEGDWATRRAAAYRAYLEWMPVREQQDSSPRLYRSFRFGGLADLIMLDTRALRDQQVAPDNLAGLADRQRTILGAAQEQWCFETLRASQKNGAAWRVIGQQVLFTRMTPVGQNVRNADTWDGYQAARERVLECLASDRINDVVILTGDVHSSWAMDVPRSPWSDYRARTGEGSLAVEFSTPAISSPPIFTDGQGRERAAALKLMLPHLKFMDGENRGYVIVDITPARVQTDYVFVPTVTSRTDAETRAMSLVTERGTAHIEAV